MASHLAESQVAQTIHEKAKHADHSEFPDDLRQASHAIELAENVASAKYNPLSPALLRLYLCLIIPYLGGCLNGYDGSLMGGLNAMSNYQQYFHMYVFENPFLQPETNTDIGRVLAQVPAWSLRCTILDPSQPCSSLVLSMTTLADVLACSLAL
jgi:hypothetical protein